MKGMNMQIDTLRKLFVEELRNIYSAEKQIDSSFPNLIQGASSSELRDAFKQHHEATKNHLERLKEIFVNMTEKLEGPVCKGIEGILRDAQELIRKTIDPEVLDAGLIAAAQKVEHYEIACYGTVRTYAELLGDHHASDLLQKTLDEEKEADIKLTSLAENEINIEARS
jgi:ferritin-like metal-binding protein YciE